MNVFLKKLETLFTDKGLRKRIFFLLAALVFFRLMANIPVPGVDSFRLAEFFEGNQFLGLLNIFSGGGLSQLSVFMLGVGAYITSSIIMQLLTVMVPRLKKLYHEEGAIGRQKFNQFSRVLTVPIALVQGFGLIILLTQQGILARGDFMTTITTLVVIVAGAMLAMWLGELMTEFGIGNGISLLIFAGIVAVMPQQISQLLFSYDPTQLLTYIGFGVAAILIIAGIVLVTEAERKIPITYAKQARGGQTYGGASTYLPLRINQAGVMPLIFAISILLFPQMIANFLVNSSKPGLQNFADWMLGLLNNGWFYSIFYFVLVFAFTYFYTAITFDSESVAQNLQKNGAFVPGVRPGQSTEQYIATVLGRVTFLGALFLGIIAVLPIAMQAITGVQSFAIGGTALLIVVAVIIDLIKRIDAQIAMREY